MNPQLEDGYIKIANEIMDALISVRIPGEQRQCLDFIIRKTYGFNKLEDHIANSQFCEATGLKKANVSRAIRGLIEKNLVIKKDNKRIPSYRFNKKYKTWNMPSKKITIKKGGSFNLEGRITITDIKCAIRKRDDNICFLCGFDGKKEPQTLPVHHIDFNEGNNEPINLVTLCRSCHGKSHTVKAKENLQSLMLSKKMGPSKKISEGGAKKMDTKDSKQKTIFLSDSIEYRLCLLLLKKIKERNPDHKKPNFQTWSKQIDLMIRVDKRDPQVIANVIGWCQDDQFWQNNILSTAKLKKQFDTLVLKMNEGNGTGTVRQRETEEEKWNRIQKPVYGLDFKNRDQLPALKKKMQEDNKKRMQK